MGPSELGQVFGAELKNCWYTAVGWSFLTRFHDLKPRSGESDQRVISKQKPGETLVNKNALCYVVLLSERLGAMLAMVMVCSLVFMVEWLVG